MYALQFYTRLIYNSINVSHTRGCVKHSLSGFIRAAAHSTIRLHLPVVILSKNLQDYWGCSFANKLQWGLALTDIPFIVHYPPQTLPSGLFFSEKVSKWHIFILYVSVYQMGKTSVMYIPGRGNNMIVYTAACRSFISMLIFLFLGVTEEPSLILSIT